MKRWLWASVVALSGCAAFGDADVPDAAEIALPADAAPPGLSFNGTAEGEAALTDAVISGRTEEFLALGGFVDGHVRRFSGDGGAVLSLALVFADEEDAGDAFRLFLDELQSEAGYGLDEGHASEWGDEGTCATGPVPTPIGQETICVWRTGSVVMALGGWMDPDRFDDIGAGMDRRASGAG